MKRAADNFRREGRSSRVLALLRRPPAHRSSVHAAGPRLLEAETSISSAHQAGSPKAHGEVAETLARSRSPRSAYLAGTAFPSVADRQRLIARWRAIFRRFAAFPCADRAQLLPAGDTVPWIAGTVHTSGLTGLTHVAGRWIRGPSAAAGCIRACGSVSGDPRRAARSKAHTFAAARVPYVRPSFRRPAGI